MVASSPLLLVSTYCVTNSPLGIVPYKDCAIDASPPEGLAHAVNDNKNETESTKARDSSLFTLLPLALMDLFFCCKCGLQPFGKMYEAAPNPYY